MEVININNKSIKKDFDLMIFMILLFSLFYIIFWLPYAKNVFSLIKSFIFILLSFFFLLNSYRKNKDLFSPNGIYNFMWFFIMGIMELQLSRLQSPLILKTYIGIFGALISFNIGTFIINNKFNYKRINKNFFVKKKNRIKFLILFYYFISVIAFAIEIKNMGGIPLFNPSEMKYLNYIHYLTLMSSFLVFITFSYIYMSKEKDFLILLVFVFSIIQLVLINSRQILMLPIISIVLIVNKKRSIDIKTVLIFLIIAITLFIFLGNYRINKLEGVNSIVDYARFEEADSDFLAWFNTYTVISVYNFQNEIQRRTVFYKGLNTFKFILDLTLLDNFIDYNFDKQSIYSGLGGNISLSSYLGSLYADFGLLWVIIIPFFYGVFCKLIYGKYLMKKSPLWSFIYANVLLMIILSTFTSYFSRSTPFVYMLIAASFFWLNKLRIRI